MMMREAENKGEVKKSNNELNESEQTNKTRVNGRERERVCVITKE